MRLALDAGHTVVALARDPNEIEPRRARRLRKFGVDLRRGAEVLSPLLKGCDYVISCLGAPTMHPPQSLPRCPHLPPTQPSPLLKGCDDVVSCLGVSPLCASPMRFACVLPPLA